MESESSHAVITGGSGSLGHAIANALRDPHWKIDSPGRADLDVTDSQAVSRYFAARHVDLLVCAAGITRDVPLARLAENAWDESWEVNFLGALACAEAVLPGMCDRHRGHIVFISSFSALHPPPGQAAYATAKAALLGLVADLAARHGPSNIRVNAVLPGFLETRMTQQVTPARRSEVLASHTLGRLNTCEHAAGFIRFLHEQMPHTSGQAFQLDSRLDHR